MLSPLAAHKDQVVVLSNLAHAHGRPAGAGDNGGDHTRCPAVFLNGVHPKRTDGADIQAGITIDQMAAAQDRPGHAAAVAGAGGRGLQRAGRLLRRRVQLHLHEHDLVADADVAAADGDQPARRVRSHVRRRRHRAGAPAAHRDAAQHSRRGHRPGAAAAGRSRRRRIATAWPSISTPCARSSAASSSPSVRRRIRSSTCRRRRPAFRTITRSTRS